MEKLKVLVLGGGFFGKNWLRALSACPECEVAGLVAKHPDILNSAGEEFGIPAARRFATIQMGWTAQAHRPRWWRFPRWCTRTRSWPRSAADCMS